MSSFEKFIRSLYENTDKQMQEVYNQQEEDKQSIFEKIGFILLTYTIVDNVLKLTLKQRNRLYNSMSKLIISLFGKETKDTTKKVEEILKDTLKNSSEFYDLEFKVELNKNAKVTGDLINKDAEKFIKKRYKGKVFSKRIWENTNEVQKEIQNEIEELLKGKTSVNEIKSKIEKKFETNKFNAKRLVDSEVARVHDEVFKKYCKDNGIDELIYKATFCNTCDDCKKDHNRKFKLDKAPELPRHPQCHCYFSYEYK